jgi:DNA uptake protein ComE-like DNA-binding protein
MTNEPFRFDPNTLSREGWIRLGFSAREAESAIKFTRKGGKFRIRKDLRKLYFIDSLEYAVLEPWMELPAEYPEKKTEKTAFKPKQVRLLELNGADTLDLQQLRGIGPYWARRIVRQRDLLGGFFRMEQLLEMKGFNDTLFRKISPQIYIDSTLIRKMPVNSISDADLQKHPYCWYGVGKSIVNYRAKHGPFREAGELRKIIAIRPEQLERLLPYLQFE